MLGWDWGRWNRWRLRSISWDPLWVVSCHGKPICQLEWCWYVQRPLSLVFGFVWLEYQSFYLKIDPQIWLLGNSFSVAVNKNRKFVLVNIDWQIKRNRRGPPVKFPISLEMFISDKQGRLPHRWCMLATLPLGQEEWSVALAQKYLVFSFSGLAGTSAYWPSLPLVQLCRPCCKCWYGLRYITILTYGMDVQQCNAVIK